MGYVDSLVRGGYGEALQDLAVSCRGRCALVLHRQGQRLTSCGLTAQPTQQQAQLRLRLHRLVAIGSIILPRFLSSLLKGQKTKSVNTVKFVHHYVVS